MKKLFLIALCFAMVLALAACEIDEPTTPSIPSNAPSNAPTNEPAVPSEVPTEPSTEPTEPSAEPTEPSTEPTEPHVHSFCEWGIAIAPSCEGEGVKERSCDCGEKETESVPALGHNYVDGACDLCGQEDPNKPKTVHLAMSYERAVTSYKVLGEMIYGYRFDFVYDADYRGGTVTLTAQERETRYGTFTCDEKYVINHVEFNDAAGILVMNAVVDEQYRNRFVEMKTVIDGVETLVYGFEADYDERGNIIRQRYCTSATGDSDQTYVYDDAGKLQSTTVAVTSGGVTTNMYMTVEYDENGYIKAYRGMDADGNILMETLYEHEVQGNLVQYTYYYNGMKQTETQDQYGKVIAQGRYTDEKNYQITENTFDENGKIVRRVITMCFDGTMATQIEEMTYLPDGRKVEHTESDGVRTVIFEQTTYQEVEIPG